MKTYQEFMNEEMSSGAIPANHTGHKITGTGDDSSVIPVKKRRKKKIKVHKRLED